MQDKKTGKGSVKGKSGASPENAPNSLKVTDDGKKSRERLMAELSLSPLVVNGGTARAFAKGYFGETDLTETVAVMREKAGRIKAGDLDDVESMLIAQAATLDSVFNELARRAALNMGEYIGAMETYLRMALKAQAQCRATLETLAEVKYPKAPTFVRQQNVAYQQQVNNGSIAGSGNNETSTHAHTRAEKSGNQSNELLEAQHGERLDGGKTGTAGGNGSQLEAVGTVNRAA